MFQSVRHWWTGGRGKVTLRLFAFEFVVVVAGVLVAQGLANWVQDRAANARMEEARAALFQQIASSAAAAQGWQRAAPCFDQRMTELMVAVGQHQSVPSALLRRPSVRMPDAVLLDEDDRQLFAQRYGDEQSKNLGLAVSGVGGMRDRIREIVEAWRGLPLVDPENGPVAEGDRLQARLAASSIKQSLIGLGISSGNVLRWAGTLGIRPDSFGAFRPLRSCDDLWETGMSHPDPERFP